MHSPERKPGNIREKERSREGERSAERCTVWGSHDCATEGHLQRNHARSRNQEITKSRNHESMKSGKHSNNTRNRELSEKLRHRLPQQRLAELLEMLDLPLTLLTPFPYFLPCSSSSDSLFDAAVAVVSSLAVPLVYQITAWQLVHNLHPCYHYIAVMDVQSRFTLSYPCPFFKQYEITYLHLCYYIVPKQDALKMREQICLPSDHGRANLERGRVPVTIRLTAGE